MARIKKKPKPPRKCIFCNGGPISKEHIWPDWMRNYLPAGQGSQIIQRSDPRASVVRLHLGPLNRKGDARSQKLKVVCAPCNNGWMSILQARTKDVLLPLLLRDTHEIGEQHLEMLATWATMFTMVYETCYENPEQRATTSQQRALFKMEQKPPQYWMFWCAPFDGRTSPVAHTGFGSVFPVGDDDTRHIGKGSLTTCGAGAIAFAIFGVNSEYGFKAFSQLITLLVERAGFVRLWPTHGMGINVLDRRSSPLTSRYMGDIHGTLRSHIEQEVAASGRRNP